MAITIKKVLGYLLFLIVWAASVFLLYPLVIHNIDSYVNEYVLMILWLSWALAPITGLFLFFKGGFKVKVAGMVHFGLWVCSASWVWACTFSM